MHLGLWSFSPRARVRKLFFCQVVVKNVLLFLCNETFPEFLLRLRYVQVGHNGWRRGVSTPVCSCEKEADLRVKHSRETKLETSCLVISHILFFHELKSRVILNMKLGSNEKPFPT